MKTIFQKQSTETVVEDLPLTREGKVTPAAAQEMIGKVFSALPSRRKIDSQMFTAEDEIVFVFSTGRIVATLHIEKQKGGSNGSK